MKTISMTVLFLILLLSSVAPLLINQTKAQNMDTSSPPQVSNTGQWWQINSTSITVLFPTNAQKPMFLWYYPDNSSQVYCVKYRGLVEYLPLNGYYTPNCEANPQTMRSLMLSEYGNMGMGMNQVGGMIGSSYQNWVSDFHPSYLPFSACSWVIAGPDQGTDQKGSHYVSFNLTLSEAPSGFDFAQNNIGFTCTFYQNETTQQPYGLYSYTIGPGQLEMDMTVKDWTWNTNYMSSFFSSMHNEYGVTVPSQTNSLALWCDFSTINMQNLEVALNDANEPLANVPQNSTLAPTGLIERSSIMTDIIAGGLQIPMQNMPESTTDALSVPTGVASPYRMQFAQGDKTLPGYFNFVNHVAIVNRTTGQAYAEPATASYRTADNYMQLFICYPYFGANALEHDPAIGIDIHAQLVPENLPLPYVITAITVVAVATAITSRKTNRKKSQRVS